MLSDLNSDPNIHVEILLIRVSLVDFLMCLNISLIALNIIINLQPNSCSMAFCIFIS